MLLRRGFLFLAFLLLMVSVNAYASDKSAAQHKADLQKMFESEKANEKRIDDLMKDIDVIAEKKTLTSKDKPELIKALKNILELEEIDPSRDGAFSLSESYIKNKKLYNSVSKEFKASEQKTLKELFKIMENLQKEGNG